MKILLLGSSGGIGTAIKEVLSGHELTCPTRSTYPTPLPRHQIDWIVFAHGTINEKDIEDTFFVNTIMPIFLTQDLLAKVEKGVIYVSSAAGVGGNDRFPVYAASKAAVNSYTTSMARKYPKLQFYAVCPGPTDTKMWRSLGLEGKAQAPIEVARVVRDCIAGEYKSGAIITVRDGVVTV